MRSSFPSRPSTIHHPARRPADVPPKPHSRAPQIKPDARDAVVAAAADAGAAGAAPVEAVAMRILV
jgi:hypothetical protein